MKKICNLTTFLLLSVIALKATATPAQPTIISKNTNTDACNITDTASFKLDKPSNITTIKVWYDAGKGGNSMKFQLLSNRGSIASGVFTKEGCDPYQGQWCNGVSNFNGMALAAGLYAIKTEAMAICANAASGNNGTIEVSGIVQGSGAGTGTPPPPGPCIPDPANCTNPFGEGCCVTPGGMVSTQPR